jgi:carbonic anhydrase
MVQELLKGFEEFRTQEYEGDSPSMPRLVKEGQNPRFFIISCIDSRSNTGTVFRAAPGTFFSHKAMGAIVRPYRQGRALAAALQYALKNGVEHIILMGHTGCGAVHSLIEGTQDPEISKFLEVAQTGLEHAKEKCPKDCSDAELHRLAEEKIILQSLENLKAFPSVSKALEEGRVTIRPWLFDMEKGQLLEHNPETGKFIVISNDHKKEENKEYDKTH